MSYLAILHELVMSKLFPVIFLLLIATSAQAAIDDYSPLAPNEHLTPWKLTPWTNQLNLAGNAKYFHFEFAESAVSYPRLYLDWDEKSMECVMQLKQRNGTVVCRASNDVSTSYNLHVFVTDLNGDTIPDYIVEDDTGDCGVSPNRILTFFLSTPKGYMVQSVIGNELDVLHDLVDLKNDGRPTLIYTKFIFGETGLDGKTHNYWVYNLMSFEGGKIVSANRLDVRFPRWILYTFKPNHNAENQLSSEQRTRLWLDESKFLSQVDKSPPFIDLEFLAKEQERVPLGMSGANTH
jgi:hypothetical protein